MHARLHRRLGEGEVEEVGDGADRDRVALHRPADESPRAHVEPLGNDPPVREPLRDPLGARALAIRDDDLLDRIPPGEAVGDRPCHHPRSEKQDLHPEDLP